MATDIDSLEPREIFRRFAEISAIPRPSGREQAVGDYLLAFAKDRGLEAMRDNSGNVLIRKPGTAGAADKPGVILQSHMDMVVIKAAGSTRDVEKYGVLPVVDGPFLKADGSSLGADNGMGMAFALAALDAGDMEHPPLEAVFTTAEETGMYGALAFDASTLRGDCLINIDSDEPGIFYASCAGGVSMKLRLPALRERVKDLPDAASLKAFRIVIDGLRGGHSGVEIHKQNGNANRLLGRVLDAVSQNGVLHLADIHGGTVDNAIPSRAAATVLIDAAREEEAKKLLADLEAEFRRELEMADGRPDSAGKVFPVRVALTPIEGVEEVFSSPVRERVIAAANLLPHGVAAMDLHLAGQLVETSSNYASVAGDGGDLLFSVSLRSSLAGKKEALARQVEVLGGMLGMAVRREGDYPAWEFNPDSRLRRVFQRAYGKVYGGEAEIAGIHAGLECGVFADAYKAIGRSLDVISYGPGLTGAHTPDERVDISSVAKSWDLLKEALRILAAGPDAS